MRNSVEHTLDRRGRERISAKPIERHQELATFAATNIAARAVMKIHVTHSAINTVLLQNPYFCGQPIRGLTIKKNYLVPKLIGSYLVSVRRLRTSFRSCGCFPAVQKTSEVPAGLRTAVSYTRNKNRRSLLHLREAGTQMYI